MEGQREAGCDTVQQDPFHSLSLPIHPHLLIYSAAVQRPHSREPIDDRGKEQSRAD